MTEESNPTEGPEDMTLADAIARAESWAQNAGIRPAPEVTRNVVRVLASEIARLQEIVQKAKQESELIQHNGRTVIAVPYWFMKS